MRQNKIDRQNREREARRNHDRFLEKRTRRKANRKMMRGRAKDDEQLKQWGLA